jgi:hypothetical protein
MPNSTSEASKASAGMTRHAGGDDGIALVVDQRSFEDHVVAGGERRLDLVGFLFRLGADHRPVRRDLDDLFFEAAAIEVRNGLAGGEHLSEARIEHFPVPLGAGEIGLRRQHRLVDVIAAHHRAAARGVLHHRLWPVDVTAENVDALIDQAVGGFRFLHRHRPIAGEDHLCGDFRIGELGAEGEGVDVAQHLRDRLGGDEAELAGFSRVAGDDAGDVLRFVDIAEIAAGVFRILVAPQAAAMLEAELRKLQRHLDHVRVVVTERRRE